MRPELPVFSFVDIGKFSLCSLVLQRTLYDILRHISTLFFLLRQNFPSFSGFPRISGRQQRERMVYCQ